MYCHFSKMSGTILILLWLKIEQSILNYIVYFCMKMPCHIKKSSIFVGVQ